MKPKIDVNSFEFKLSHTVLNKEVKRALEIETTVEKGVIPIAAILKTRAHRNPKKQPEQIGSGVLVKIKDQYFIFSSTHVFTEFEGKSFFTSSGGYTKIEEISGERFSSGTIENKIDQFDATVFHIQNPITQELKNLALSLEDFDFSSYDKDKPIFMITGFRVKESNTAGSLLTSKASNFPTVEIEDYKQYGIDSNSHILLSYEDQVFVEGVWQNSPKPKGLSGGAIIKAQGTSINFKDINVLSKKPYRQLLSAITHEYQKDKGDRLGFVIGTRINVYLGLIDKFMPGLLNEFLEKYKNE